MRFRGRQIVHAELGRKVFDRFVELVESGVVERAAQIEGRNMIMIMAPKPDAAPKSEKGKAES